MPKLGHGKCYCIVTDSAIAIAMSLNIYLNQSEDGLQNMMPEILDLKIHFQNLFHCVSIPSDKIDQGSSYPIHYYII